MLRRLLITLILAAGCSTLTALPVMAAPPVQGMQLMQTRDQSDNRGARLISAKQAAKRAQQQYGGRVLSVSLRDNSGDPFYAVKLIKNGQVKIIYIPASN